MDRHANTPGLNAFILRSPWFSVTLAAASLVLAVSGVSLAAGDAGDAPAWVTWVALVLMADGMTLAIVFPRLVKKPPPEVIGLQFAFAVSAGALGALAVAVGAPSWVGWMGVGAAVAGMAGAVLTATSART